MSDGKEVKQKECVTHHHACDCREAMHEAIVAELRAEVERYKYLYEDYSSEVEELQHERRKLETTIATQARVIEKLREQRNRMMLMGDMRAFCDKELAAIEKEGAQDET